MLFCCKYTWSNLVLAFVLIYNFPMEAEELFKKGYNCAQSVFCANCEKVGIDFETGLKLTSSFGGGMGRLREVCGAVSAMFMLVGLKKGYITFDNDEIKETHYAKVQELAKKFEEKYGSIICRDLLGLPGGKSIPKPSKRTEEYYQERPCEEFIKFASELIKEEL